MNPRPFAIAVLAPLLLLCTVVADDAPQRHWPGFRGPQASGVMENVTTATTWDVPSGKGVKWKTPVAGLGLSSPAVWGDRIFITTAVKEGEEQKLKVGLYGDIAPVEDGAAMAFNVVCLDAGSGKVLWERTAHKGVPKVKRHPKSSHANPSCATDGKRVVAFFGSEGLHCFDVDGKPLWKKDLGLLDSGFFMVPGAQWGFASSPVIAGNKVIVQCDVQKGSFLAAFDLESGKELWRTPRGDVPTWSTPTVIGSGDGAQVLCNGYKEIAAYTLNDGKKVWTMGGGGDIPTPTPIVAHDLVFITSAHGPQEPIFAIRTNARGDVSLPKGKESSEFVPWSRQRGGNYMQTPLVYGEELYCCRDNGLLTCSNARTGKAHYSRRLEGGVGFTASPVAADNKVYFTSEDGQVHVVQAGTTFKELAVNPLGEISMATPAITSDGTLLFRTQSRVVAIGGAK